MPTYDYLCEACGHSFELYQSFHDDPASICTQCGGPVRRVFAPAPIIFKGSGWYVTDSKRPNAGLTASKDKRGAAKAAAAGESKGSEGDASDKAPTTTPAAKETRGTTPAGGGDKGA